MMKATAKTILSAAEAFAATEVQKISVIGWQHKIKHRRWP